MTEKKNKRLTCDSRDAQMNGELLSLPTAFYIYQEHSGRVWSCEMTEGPEKYKIAMGLKDPLNGSRLRNQLNGIRWAHNNRIKI